MSRTIDHNYAFNPLCAIQMNIGTKKRTLTMIMTATKRLAAKSRKHWNTSNTFQNIQIGVIWRQRINCWKLVMRTMLLRTVLYRWPRMFIMRTERSVLRKYVSESIRHIKCLTYYAVNDPENQKAIERVSEIYENDSPFHPMSDEKRTKIIELRSTYETITLWLFILKYLY